MQGGGVELDKCSRSKRASLELIASSTAFSFLSCAQSLSIRSISLASALIRFSCKIFLRSNSIALISRSTTGRQLSIANQRRQRGKKERNADLLIELDGAESGELDMVVAGEQGDQGQQQASDNGDPARKVQTQHNHSQQRSSAIHPGASPPVRQAWKYLIAVAIASLNDRQGNPLQADGVEVGQRFAGRGDQPSRRAVSRAGAWLGLPLLEPLPQNQRIATARSPAARR